MYHIVLCEDDLEQGKMLSDTIRQVLNEHVSIFICQSATELEDHLQTHPAPEIVFMDIELGSGENGIDAVKRLIPETLKTQVIYITGYLKYCTQVYSTSHVSFLVKPFQSAEVKTALEQAFFKIEQLQQKGLCINIRSHVIYLPFSHIKYVESIGRKLRFVCIDATYESYMRLKDIAFALDPRFFQCHKSYIVNLDQISSYDSKNYTLRSGEFIPISIHYRQNAKRAFLDYLGQDISLPLQ